MIRSAAKANISRTRSPSACCSTSSSSVILSSVIVISVFGFECCNPNLCRRSTVAATVTNGRALRYAGGSARGLLHQSLGHCHGDGGDLALVGLVRRFFFGGTRLACDFWGPK